MILQVVVIGVVIILYLYEHSFKSAW
jgi:hypothetical protein